MTTDFSNFLSLSSLENWSTELIFALLKQHKFVCLRGLIKEESVQNAKQILQLSFNKDRDHPTTGETPEQVKNNFQKLAIGSVHSQHHQGSYARLVRTFYNPLWAEDIYQMHDIFRSMIAVRNKLLNKPRNFVSNTIEDNLWTAARIHQYPSGGGFMQAHKDTTLKNVSRAVNLNYFQVMLIMSQKGVDFQEGGGFILQGKNRWLFEEHCQPGNLVIYNSQTLHGVADIDPHKNLDLETLSGRLAAFVSLYRNF